MPPLSLTGSLGGLARGTGAPSEWLAAHKVGHKVGRPRGGSRSPKGWAAQATLLELAMTTRPEAKILASCLWLLAGPSPPSA